MAKITMKGDPTQTVGDLPPIGAQPPKFTLVRKDLSEISSDKIKGKKVLLNIFPSLDTGVCAMSVKKFSKMLSSHPEVAIFHISKDLPFAQGRFCSTEAMPNCETLSAFNSNFGKDYGVEIKDGPLRGLLSRAVVVLDENGKIIYEEQVSEIASEPNYDKAVAALGIKQNIPAI